MKITIVGRKDGTLTPEIERDISKLRYATFATRLGWDVETFGDQEFDRFDTLEAQYVVAMNNGLLYGCWRLLPTVGPNMLRDVFPELLGGDDAPSSVEAWELSRFAVAGPQNSAFGFSTVPVEMMLAAVRHARREQVSLFVTVTTLAMERLLKHLQLRPRRLGPPLLIGSVRTVALGIDTNRATENALVAALSMKKTSARTALPTRFPVRPRYAAQGGAVSV